MKLICAWSRHQERMDQKTPRSRAFSPMLCHGAARIFLTASLSYVLQSLEPLAKKLRRRLLIASALHKNVKHVIVLVDSPPQVMPLPIDGEKHLIQVPLVARPPAPVTELIGVVLPKLPTPLADRFVGHGDAAFEQEFLHVAVAQGEAIVEPDPMADDFTGKAMVLVMRGVGRRGHAWLHIRGFGGSLRGQRQEQLCHGSGSVVNKLTMPLVE